MLDLGWNKNPKILNESLTLCSNLLRLLVEEALDRSELLLLEENPSDTTSAIEPELLERILPQLLLDFH